MFFKDFDIYIYSFFNNKTSFFRPVQSLIKWGIICKSGSVYLKFMFLICGTLLYLFEIWPIHILRSISLRTWSRLDFSANLFLYASSQCCMIFLYHKVWGYQIFLHFFITFSRFGHVRKTNAVGSILIIGRNKCQEKFSNTKNCSLFVGSLKIRLAPYKISSLKLIRLRPSLSPLFCYIEFEALCRIVFNSLEITPLL